MRIHFILVESIYPENIGSAARAMKTMGFDSLRLVNTCNHLAKEAKWLAHGSTEILIEAHTFKNFNDAISDIDYLIGTTSKSRTVKFDYYTAEKLPDIIRNKKNLINSIGIVFGGEEAGLSNDILSKCDIASTIPMKTKYPSINLAQSVMIYAYILSEININKRINKKIVKQQKSYKELKLKTDQILKDTEILKGSNIYNRIFERLAVMSANDINLVHSICNAIINVHQSHEEH